MNFSKVNKLLQEQIRVMESEGGPALPRMFSDSQERSIRGIFNDMLDIVGQSTWGYKVTGTRMGSSGQINFGMSVETGPGRSVARGVRLIAHANPDTITVYVVSAKSPKTMSTPESQLSAVPKVVFPADGGEYQRLQTSLADKIRKALSQR